MQEIHQSRGGLAFLPRSITRLIAPFPVGFAHMRVVVWLSKLIPRAAGQRAAFPNHFVGAESKEALLRSHVELVFQQSRCSKDSFSKVSLMEDLRFLSARPDHRQFKI